MRDLAAPVRVRWLLLSALLAVMGGVPACRSVALVPDGGPPAADGSAGQTGGDGDASGSAGDAAAEPGGGGQGGDARDGGADAPDGTLSCAGLARSACLQRADCRADSCPSVNGPIFFGCVSPDVPVRSCIIP